MGYYDIKHKCGHENRCYITKDRGNSIENKISYLESIICYKCENKKDLERVSKDENYKQIKILYKEHKKYKEKNKLPYIPDYNSYNPEDKTMKCFIKIDDYVEHEMNYDDYIEENEWFLCNFITIPNSYDKENNTIKIYLDKMCKDEY